jgi:hypothetical protein
MFVFELGVWTKVGLGFTDPSELIGLYVLVRFQGSFSSLFSVDLNRMKKAWANPNTMNNNTTKNGKTSLATPTIIIKYFPNDGNTRKNNKNLKFSKKLESDMSQRDGSVSVISQYMDVIMGKEYAPISKKDDFQLKKANRLYIKFILITYQIDSRNPLYKFLVSIKIVGIQKINVQNQG